MPKCGWVRFRISREWQDIGAASSARVTKDRIGRWFVSFIRPAPELERKSTGAIVGLDMGVASTLTTSDGRFLQMSKLLSDGQRQRKRRLQRKLARQTKGFSRRKRTKLAIAKLAAKETGARTGCEKTTTTLVRDYDLIAIEDLKVKNMTRLAKGTIGNPGKNVRAKSGLNRSILEQGWGMFRQRLTDKATNATEPATVTVINPAYTSLRCSECGYTDKRNRKSQAIFCCLSCNYTANADVNAARNIISTAAGLAVQGRPGTSHANKHSDPVKRQPPEAA
ncbi:MAG: RNA-guided endonuclease InsQ/TnpB family protein [Ferrimicrobium sp.]